MRIARKGTLPLLAAGTAGAGQSRSPLFPVHGRRGGEPCLRSDFIALFHRLMPSEWHLYIETSLAVAPQHIETLAPLIDHWFIDVKDLHPDIYHRYTQHDIAPLMHNLLLLKKLGMQDRCTLRLPLIPDYNDEALRAESQQQLQDLGFTHFDLFQYIVRN